MLIYAPPLACRLHGSVTSFSPPVSGKKWSWSGGKTLFCMFMMGKNNLSGQMKRAVGSPDRHAVICQNETAPVLQVSRCLFAVQSWKNWSVLCFCLDVEATDVHHIFSYLSVWPSPPSWMDFDTLVSGSATFDVTWHAAWSSSPVSVWEGTHTQRLGEPSVRQVLEDQLRLKHAPLCRKNTSEGFKCRERALLFPRALCIGMIFK